MEGTRQEVIGNIIAWIDGGSDHPNVLDVWVSWVGKVSDIKDGR